MKIYVPTEIKHIKLILYFITTVIQFNGSFKCNIVHFFTCPLKIMKNEQQPEIKMKLFNLIQNKFMR